MADGLGDSIVREFTDGWSLVSSIHDFFEIFSPIAVLNHVGCCDHSLVGANKCPILIIFVDFLSDKQSTIGQIYSIKTLKTSIWSSSPS